MERVRFAPDPASPGDGPDVESAVQPAAIMRPLTRALGCTDLAANYYELATGDSFAFAYHSHDAQEEVFVVLSGTATWETDEGDVAVGPGEAIRFAPGERQRGWNRGDERVRAIALGAPLEYAGGDRLVTCPDCGARTSHDIVEPDEDADARAVVCAECGGETQRWRRGPDGENVWVR